MQQRCANFYVQCCGVCQEMQLADEHIENVNKLMGLEMFNEHMLHFKFLVSTVHAACLARRHRWIEIVSFFIFRLLLLLLQLRLLPQLLPRL
jgi:hypothetical protein